MIKFVISFLFFFKILVTPISAKIIENIKIEGNQRIPEQTIIMLGKIKAGEDYDNLKLNEIIKNLYDSNFFKDISLSIEGSTLFIKLIENYIIENIEFIGLKNKNLKSFIEENIDLKNQMSFTDYQLQNDLIKIKNILKTNGYYFANVEVSSQVTKEFNSIKLTFEIDLGKKAKIKKISFLGNKSIKDKKLLEVIASEETRFWKFISNNVYLNQLTIDLDKRLLENYYKNLGYYNVKINDSFVQLREDGDFELIFNINSGKKYYFNDFKLNLPEDYVLSDFEKIQQIFSELRNEKYSLNKFNSILKEIDKIATSKLYDFIDANVEETIIDNDKINFTFNIIDSEKFFVEKINVFGNFNTIEEVIRNKLIVDEGDPLNLLLFDKSIDNIKSLRIFNNVKSEVIDGSNDNLKIININVEEKPTGEISLAAGVGTSGTVIGGGIKENNFLGKGINLSTNLELSENSIKGLFNYSKPNFAFTDNTLSTSLFALTEDFLNESGYELSKTGFSLGTSYEQFDNLFFSPEFAFSNENLKTNTSASSQLKKQEGTYSDIYFNYGFDYDLRNSKYEPTSGHTIGFYQNFPIISNGNELSNTLVTNYYTTFDDSEEVIGKASLYFKTITSINNSDVRISKRGQVPYNRLRGFERNKIGPVENSDYIGGNYVASLNLSSNIPGVLNTVENIDFSYFIDIANVWGVDYSDLLDNSNVLRSSTGIGMNILTPVGPLSFSLTQPLTKASTDKTESFRFNLGTSF